MPVFEYQCEDCSHSFTRLVFKGDNEDIRCPECGGSRVKKLLTPESFMDSSGIGTCAACAGKGFS